MFKVVTSSVFKELLLVLRSQTHAYSLKVVLAKKDTIYWKSTPVISICHFPHVFLPYLFVFFPMCSYISSISNMSNHQYSHWSLCVFVAQSCPTLCDPKDCSSPGSSVYVILQARILEWGAISFSRGSSQPRDWTQVSFTTGRCFTIWATREALYNNIHVAYTTWPLPFTCLDISGKPIDNIAAIMQLTV